jgi:hypothetical protein
MKRTIEKTAMARRNNEAGVTLVELVISTALAAMLSAGLFYMMAGQSNNYSRQLNNVTSTQALWGAMEFIQRQIRHAGAGFAGCPSGEVRVYDAADGTARSLFSGLTIYNNCNLLKRKPADCDSPADAADDGVDSFVVTYANGFDASPNGLSMHSHNTPPTAANNFIESPAGLKADDFILFTLPGTDAQCVLMQLTSDEMLSGDKWKLIHNSGISDFNPPGGFNMFDSYPDDRWGEVQIIPLIAQYNSIPRFFAIDSDSNPPKLVTWSTSSMDDPKSDMGNLEVVAEGIEDLQLAAACDDNGNGTLETTTKETEDEWAYNALGDVVPDCIALGRNPGGAQNILAVRVSLTMRSGTEKSSGPKGKRAAAEDHPEALGSDRYQRNYLTASVRPRNLRPNFISE